MTKILNHKERFISVLTESAEKLTSGCAFPLEINSIIARFQIRVTRETLPPREARLAQTTAGYIVKLPRKDRKNDSFTSQERFMLAHEIGHIILSEECSESPIGKSEYWQHEEMCNFFARSLLLPVNVVENVRRRGLSTPNEILDNVSHLSRVGKVPWYVAAHRVADFENEVLLFKISDTSSDAFKIVVSTLPNNKEIGRKIRKTSELGRTLYSLDETTKEVELDSTMFDGDAIPSCKGATRGLARTCWGGIYLSATRQEPPRGMEKIVERQHSIFE